MVAEAEDGGGIVPPAAAGAVVALLAAILAAALVRAALPVPAFLTVLAARAARLGG